MTLAKRRHSRIDALDGIRTIAVFLVIAFHVSFPRMNAGYLGVDVFFVLSGFLITNSLLKSLESKGKIDLKHFWSRRIARLMPAALITVSAVLIWSWSVGLLYVRASVGNDAWYTIFYLANWHFIGADSYFESDGTQSPLMHMWSLAVEEQFYLLWPLLIIGVLFVVSKFSKNFLQIKAKNYLTLVAGSVILISLALLAVHYPSSVNRAYMGTDSKAFEPMIGAMAALISLEEGAKRFFSRHAKVLVWGGGITMAVLFVFLDGPSSFYFFGGAALFSVATAALILGIRYGLDNFEAKILAWQPIAYLGRISYGLYLWHWPWAVWLITPGAGFQPTKALLAIAATIVTSIVSYHLIEMPIREGSISKLLTETTTIITGISSMLLVALFAGATGGTPISKPIFNLIYGTTLDRNTIMVVGDSVPLRLMPDFTKAAKTEGLSVISAAKGGCSPLGVNQVTDPQNPTPSTCPSAIATQEETLESYRPGYVLWWSRYEIMDRYKENQLLSPSAEEFWQAQEEEFIKSANRLTADGAKLVIVLTERPGLGTLNRPETELNAPIIKYMMYHDEYRQRFNRIVEKVAASRNDITTINGDSMFCSTAPTGRSDSLCDDSINGKFVRYDGSHIDMKAFGNLISEKLLAEFEESTHR